MTSEALCDLGPASLSFLISTLPYLVPDAAATLASVMFLSYGRQSLISGFLDLLFPLPQILYLQMFSMLVSLFHLELRYHLTCEAFCKPPPWNSHDSPSPPPPWNFLSMPCLVSLPCTYHHLTCSLSIFCYLLVICLPQLEIWATVSPLPGTYNGHLMSTCKYC